MPAFIPPTGKKGGAMPPPAAPGKKAAPKFPDTMPPPAFGRDEPEAKPEGDEGPGLSPEEVHYSADDLCSDCAHAQGGSCGKYQFAISPNGHCAAGFEPQGGEGGAAPEGAEEGSSPWDQSA